MRIRVTVAHTFATLLGGAVAISDLDKSLTPGEDIFAGRLGLDEDWRWRWSSVTASGNHCIRINNIIKDTNVIFSRAEVENLVIPLVEGPETGVVVLVVAQAYGVADLK